MTRGLLIDSRIPATPPSIITLHFLLSSRTTSALGRNAACGHIVSLPCLAIGDALHSAPRKRRPSLSSVECAVASHPLVRVRTGSVARSSRSHARRTHSEQPLARSRRDSVAGDAVTHTHTNQTLVSTQPTQVDKRHSLSPLPHPAPRSPLSPPSRSRSRHRSVRARTNPIEPRGAPYLGFRPPRRRGRIHPAAAPRRRGRRLRRGN
jgi:hypothetical protein